MRRRTLLATLPVIATAGCSSVSDLGSTPTPEHALGENDWHNIQTEVDRQDYSVTITAELEIDAGRYATRTFDPERDFDYELTVDVEEGMIDVFLFDEDEYDDRYRERDPDIQYYQDFSNTMVDGERTFTGSLSDGDYVWVLDNTAVYGAAPEGEAELSMELFAQV